ncbi:MAG: 30S ribosomal protein S12 methylthiotransferase RimO [Lachnospiraceae bacterium]|nr:30S ribosomal protein S12 methylthiotransferase RimO [Lachnospiraceae bacterium]
MKVTIISLGCDKNLVDSEKILAQLSERGYEITDVPEEADVAVINTCCFIHDAKQESIDTILMTAELKKTGRLQFLVITGCLATRYSDDIQALIPEVDAIIVSSASDEIDRVIKELFSKSLSKKIVKKDIDKEPVLSKNRLYNTLKNHAYIKIADGCDKHCTYCVIPSIKGKYRSFKFEDIITEAEEAVKHGKNEIILVAQETTLYGVDLYGHKRIAELLRELNKIEGLEWIRLMYCYPEEIDDDLVSAIRDCDKVCKYIDMPIQHISDQVLKRMGRRTSGQDIKDTINKLRENIPNIVIRTSLITGFPMETEEEHHELLKFIKEYKLERLGVFTYSKEEGTPAAKLRPQIRKPEKNKRRDELMTAQQKVVFAQNKALKGRVLKAVIEGMLPTEGVYIGRTMRDAPDVDGCIFIKSDRELVLGTMVDVKIKKASGYDLSGEIIE